MIDKCLLFIATLGPLGYLPAGGTWASLFTLNMWWIAYDYSATLTMYLVGIAICASVPIIEHALDFFDDEDPCQIVLDEFMGMSVAFLLANKEPTSLITTFFIFRVLDIIKPSLIGRMELCPGALGVIGDDVVAGFLAVTLSNALFHSLYVMSML